VKEDASEIESAETGNGDSGTRTVEALQEEQGARQDEQEGFVGFRLDSRETTAEKVKKALEARRRGWPKGKPRK